MAYDWRTWGCSVTNQVNIPVIASGGAGDPGHVVDDFSKTNASAVSAANFFHFTEHSVVATKSVLRNNNIDIRLDTNADYEHALLDDEYRLKRQTDDYLENLLYKKIEVETI